MLVYWLSLERARNKRSQNFPGFVAKKSKLQKSSLAFLKKPAIILLVCEIFLKQQI